MKQDKIWDYFQGEGVNNYAAAWPRLYYLVQLAACLTPKINPTVLNIGTGNGTLEIECRKRGWKAFSLDPSRVAIQRMYMHGVPGEVGLIESIPFKKESFNFVFCSEVFEHLTPDQMNTGLIDIKHILKPGGSLLGTVPFNECLESKQTVCPACGNVFHYVGHQQSFTLPAMREILVRAGMRPVKLFVRSFPDFSRRSPKGLIKSSVRYILGVMGEPIASPHLVFAVQKPS